ncbi:uncharacterized protein [Amphiura filiformis]|uniref:uncharacterized protein n=1 Tax=Amphiura filiformis TaxID=82378 RepID=UPI003B21F28E
MSFDQVKRLPYLVHCLCWFWTILAENESRKMVLPFINDADVSNCSWVFSDIGGSQQKIQPCHALSYVDTDTCPHRIPDATTVDDRAASVDDLKLTEITKYLQFDDPRRNGNYTCIHISYVIDTHDARLVQAVQISLHSMDIIFDQGEHLCQVHDYRNGSTSSLTYSSVTSHCGREVETDALCRNARKVFIHDKFCGVVPGAQYDVSVRTLPADYNGSRGYDTKLTIRYPTHAENASQNCDGKPGDIRCQKNKQASWKSEFINVQQDNSQRSNDVVNLNITFDIAPADYKFDQYKVLVYLYNNGRGDYYKGHTFKLQETTWIVNEVRVTNCYVVRILPNPQAGICTIGIDKRNTRCDSTWGEPFCPKVHPCTRHPCSSHGRCESLDGENHTCICDSGYHPYNNTCLQNPCLNAFGNETGLCGPFGICHFETTGSDAAQPNHTCSCKQGYQPHPERMCDKGVDYRSANLTAPNVKEKHAAVIYLVIGGSLLGVLLVAVFVLGMYYKYKAHIQHNANNIDKAEGEASVNFPQAPMHHNADNRDNAKDEASVNQPEDMLSPDESTLQDLSIFLSPII